MPKARSALAQEGDKPHHEFMMVWHEMQRRIGEDEVNLIVWLPCFYVLLYELGGDDAGTRDASLKANPVPMGEFSDQLHGA